MENTAYIVQETLEERVTARLTELGMSKKELADRIGLSRTTVSRFLSGTYNADTSDIKERLEEWLDSMEDATVEEETAFRLPQKPERYANADYSSIFGLCSRCQKEGEIGMLIGRSGTGKTYSLQDYAKSPRVVYLECDATMGKKDLLADIARGIGLESRYGTLHERKRQIVEFFRVNRGYLLIIDEADKLTSKDTIEKIELLRWIYDQTRVGLVLAGEPQLKTTINQHLPRLSNRVGLFYKMGGLSRKEVREYFDGFEIAEDAMEEMIVRACNDRTGCFRLLDRTVNNVLRIMENKRTERITMDIIREASSMMML